MAALLLLVSCFGLGVLVTRFASPPSQLAAGLNFWVLQIALPSLVLLLIPRLTWSLQFWFLAVSQWFIFAGAWWFFSWWGKRRAWSPQRIGCLVLMSGLGNTSFVGYPAIEALRGREGLALAVVADQMGCFLALALGGLSVASIYSGSAPEPRAIARKILSFPATTALIVGVLVGQLGGWPLALEELFERLGSTLSPLALFSVGLRFRFQVEPLHFPFLGLSLGWKLLIGPSLLVLLGRLTQVDETTLSVGVLQAAMAPMVSASILADQHQLEPDLARSILGLGLVLSVFTLTGFNWYL